MQRLMILVVLVGVGAASLTAGGCARRARIDVPIAGLPPQPEYATLLDVENFKGSVRVIVDATREPGVWARVLREGREAPRRRSELRKLVDVEATSSLEDGARLLRVVTSPEPEAKDVAVELTVRIARSAGTAVRNSGGIVELIGVSGPVHVENGIGGARGGDIYVRTAQAMTAPAFVHSTTGSVVYQVGPGSRGQFDLRSEGGYAEFTSRVGRVDNVRSTHNRWTGTLNNGTNEVVLRGEGTVRAAVMENAESYMPYVRNGYAPERWMARLRGE